MFSATTKYIRVSPQKARWMGDLIRGKSVANALLQLTCFNCKSAPILKKVLMSAVANAENSEHNDSLSRDDLYISELRIDQGPQYERAWARSKGRRAPILKKTSHFFIVLDIIK